MTTKSLVGVSELLIFHPVDTIAKRLMSNKAKVTPQLSRSEAHADRVKGLILCPELDHFPRCRLSTGTQKAAVALPRSRVCGGIQDLAADLQIRWSTVVQRLDQEKLQGQLHKHVWRTERKADDASNRWQVCLTFSCCKFPVDLHTVQVLQALVKLCVWSESDSTPY